MQEIKIISDEQTTRMFLNGKEIHHITEIDFHASVGELARCSLKRYLDAERNPNMREEIEVFREN